MQLTILIPPPCRYASEPREWTGAPPGVEHGNRHSVKCRRNQFGGRPSFAVCIRDCPVSVYKGPERTPALIETVMTGRKVTRLHYALRLWTRRGRSLMWPVKTGRFGTCRNSTPMYRWLVWTWYGWPMPLRWLAWLRDVLACAHYTRFSGCGCTVVGKTAWLRLRWWWQYTYC